MTSHRYTLDGGPSLEARIAQDMERITNAVVDAVGTKQVIAFILGGGYGRGEGAVLCEEGTESIYNDYDFFVVTPTTSLRSRRILAHRLQQLGKRLAPEFGVHLDFGVLEQRKLAHMPYELMMMELKEGHIVCHGPSDILTCMPDYDTRRPPLEEGARLLLNRGTGLLLSRRRLRRGSESDSADYKFVVRNIQKALLAAGDAVLFIQQAYTPSYAARSDAFDALDLRGVPDVEGIRSRYKAALAFKLRPKHETPAGSILGGWLEEALRDFGEIHLWFERRRLGDKTLSWEAYAARPWLVPQKSLTEACTNIFRNLRVRGPIGMPLTRLPLHPRDRLFRTLPRLLYYETGAASEDAYLRLWHRYN